MNVSQAAGANKPSSNPPVSLESIHGLLIKVLDAIQTLQDTVEEMDQRVRDIEIDRPGFGIERGE